jgi:hypothetical protein
LQGSSTARDVFARVQVDDVSTDAEYVVQPSAATDWAPFSGFFYKNLTAAVHDIDLDYAADTGSTTYIRRARLEFFEQT